jgi:hypothetical protein
MKVVGIDLHTNQFTCCYRDETNNTKETKTFELDEAGLAALRLILMPL